MFPWPDSGEPLRCDQFMSAALHDPEHGYYSRHIRGIGARGDFTTAVPLSPALARAIAVWAGAAMKATGTRHLIELGPGDGMLAAGVLAHFPYWRRPSLHLVETSAPLRKQQRERLGRRAVWHPDVVSALEACGGKACLWSNEFFDAFPARRFRWSGNAWEESFVWPQGEQWQPAGPLPDSSVFGRNWPSGQIVEVQESVANWLRQMCARWERGAMLTVDYGGVVRALYHRLPGGSLRSYFHHMRFAGDQAFALPGRQDITVDVNFTDLDRWLSPSANSADPQSLHDFLAPHLDPQNHADRFVADSSGAGGAFLVMESRCKLDFARSG